jgi:hypothetical protein
MIVFCWPTSEVATRLVKVGLLKPSGPDLLTLSSSRFDPQRSFEWGASRNATRRSQKDVLSSHASLPF